MPRTELIYFDNLSASGKGTLRGLIAFGILIIGLPGVGLIFRKIFTKGMWTKIITLILSALILCSAVGVQQPTENDEAFLYGLLVGFSISIIASCLLVNIVKVPIFYVTLFVIYLSLLVGATSLITYKLGDKLKIY